MSSASQQKRLPVAASLPVQGPPSPFPPQGQGGSVQEELDAFRAVGISVATLL